MVHLPVLLVISLILPVLCYVPADYGFTDNGDGYFYRDGVNIEDGSQYRIWMNIDANGNAAFSRQGNSYGNGVNSYDMTNNVYYMEGYGKPGLPISGWDVPGGSRISPSIRQTSGIPSGFDDTGFAARMEEHRRGMEELKRGLAQIDTTRGYGGDGFNMQAMGTINNVGQMRGKNNGGVYGISRGARTINNVGKYYGIKYTRNDNNDDCTETIVIQGILGSPTQAINDEFRPKCTKGEVRAMQWSDPLLVGGADQNFCAYGQTDFPNQLIVIEDGVCKIKTYSLKSATTKVTKLGIDDCEKIKSLIQSVQGVLENANAGSNEGNVLIEKLSELKGLVKKLGTGGAEESMSKGPVASAQSAASYPTNIEHQGVPSNEALKKKKQRGWLQKLWIFIKNVFRVLTFQRIKDE